MQACADATLFVGVIDEEGDFTGIYSDRLRPVAVALGGVEINRASEGEFGHARRLGEGGCSSLTPYFGRSDNAVDPGHEGAPADVDVEDLRGAVLATHGVVAIHDLHIWTLTSQRHVLTAHVVIGGAADRQALLETLSAMLRERFRLAHTTLQLEDEACGDLHAPLHDADHDPKLSGHSDRHA